MIGSLMITIIMNTMMIGTTTFVLLVDMKMNAVLLLRHKKDVHKDVVAMDVTVTIVKIMDVHIVDVTMKVMMVISNVMTNDVDGQEVEIIIGRIKMIIIKIIILI